MSSVAPEPALDDCTQFVRMVVCALVEDVGCKVGRPDEPLKFLE